jgi:putative ABC transport system permease protein
MSNAYFGNGDAQASLTALGRTTDGVLVSDETVTDFQLQSGDMINLRLQSAADRQYHVVPFRFVGIVREFPTAPRDSFLVANAGYISKMTGIAGPEVVLMRVIGDPRVVRDRAAELTRDVPGASVRDITEVSQLIGSSLTAIDLKGLSRLELAYAIILVGFGTGLILALGVLDRRRAFAIIAAIGAKPPQLLAFLKSEALVIFVGGSTWGALTGTFVAWMLVKMLAGAFDPPPDHITFPWLYLACLFVAAAVASAMAVSVVGRRIGASPMLFLRE